MSEAQFRIGDVFERLTEIPDGSIDLLVTSPPFLALRSYLPADHPDKGKEIGSEPTPAAFLSTLLTLTAEWRRVLAPHGSICVELGDTYSGSVAFDGTDDFSIKKGRGKMLMAGTGPTRNRKGDGWPLDKSLCLLPTLYPASLAYGRNLLTGEPCQPWRVRNLIVWHRPNPPVGALGDKVRPSTSYVTVASTARNRWFDLDAERTAYVHQDRIGKPINNGRGDTYADGVKSSWTNKADFLITDKGGAPPLDCWFDDEPDSDVWTIPTQPYAGAHYATFPIKLPRKLINLMCPRQVCTTCGEPRRRIVGETTYERHGQPCAADSANFTGLQGRRHSTGHSVAITPTLGWSDCGHDSYRRGLVLDPFAGSGTTLVAASELGRDSIGIDLDERNLDLARQRIGMFLNEEPVA